MHINLLYELNSCNHYELKLIMKKMIVYLMYRKRVHYCVYI